MVVSWRKRHGIVSNLGFLYEDVGALGYGLVRVL